MSISICMFMYLFKRRESRKKISQLIDLEIEITSKSLTSKVDHAVICKISDPVDKSITTLLIVPTLAK